MEQVVVVHKGSLIGTHGGIFEGNNYIVIGAVVSFMNGVGDGTNFTRNIIPLIGATNSTWDGLADDFIVLR